MELSDQWGFWEHGYEALMVTDTALFRNPDYHRPTDLPDRIEWDRFARVTAGMLHVAIALANEG